MLLVKAGGHLNEVEFTEALKKKKKEVLFPPKHDKDLRKSAHIFIVKKAKNAWREFLEEKKENMSSEEA